MILRKGALLDAVTLGDDVSFDGLQQTGIDWQIYSQTSHQELVERIQSCEVIITNKVNIDANVMAQCPDLKLICIAATGMNNVDLDAAHSLNISVTNVTGYATASVVQHVMMCMLTLTTRLLDYRAALQRGDWQRSDMFCLLNYPIHELAEKTLGIIGYGELGQAVAQAATSFGMRVVVAESLTGSKHANRLPLDEVLKQADIISLHCPLSDESAGLFNSQRLAAMKPGALLINTARGGIVDESALLHSLEHGHLGGAAIDVLATEPPGDDSPLLKVNLTNLIVTPHIAWASRASRQRLFDGVVEKITRYQSALNDKPE